MMTNKEIEQAKREELIKENPHLISVNEGGNGKPARVIAAKNLRIELKKAYTAVKFSIRTKVFSGGDDMTVNYDDGPRIAVIRKMAEKYESGNFDGMEDIYNYNSTAWTRTFGDVKYSSVSRGITYKTAMTIFEKLIPEIMGNLEGKKMPVLVEHHGGYYISEENNPDLFDSREIYHTFSNMFYRLLAKLDFTKCPAENYNPKGLRLMFFSNR
jgi:hypothetical protein